MNRLTLIGNGFDLAHGLRTSYNDFILWYLKSSFAIAAANDYSDPLIEITRDRLFYRSHPSFDPQRIEALVDHYYKRGFQDILRDKVFLNQQGLNNQEPFLVDIKSELLRVLLSNCSHTTWVEIEMEFYGSLKGILNSQDHYTDKQQRLASLNQSLAYIIEKLEEYLIQLPSPQLDDRYLDIFKSSLKKFDILLPWSEGPQWRSEERFKIDRRFILNFNYTSTVQQYVDKLDLNIELINIHGQLNSGPNPIIFGFGDELDEDYLRMERERAKGYFNYIKSFWYFRNYNYGEIIRFIDSGEFQIHVLGHSCGLSDRTMLHMIFEHPNCKSIRIFYYDNGTQNNFTALTYEIARHFSDKAEMRKRIVPFDRSEPMPQVR